MLCWQLVPWLVEVDVFLVGKRNQHAMEILRMSGTPRRQCTAAQSHRTIRNHKVRIHFVLGTKAVTVLTCTEGRVEREVTWCQFLKAGPAFWTRQMLAEGQSFALFSLFGNQFDPCYTFSKTQGGLERVSQSTLNVITSHKTIDDDVDGVVFISSQFVARCKKFGDVTHFVIDARANKSLCSKVAQKSVVFAFATAHNRCQNLKPCALRQCHDAVDYLLRSLTLKFCAVGRTMLNADARV